MIITATEWKKGEAKIDGFMFQCQRMIDLADLIKQKEREYNECIRRSLSELCNDGTDVAKQLKESYLSDARIRKHQALRLNRYLTNLILEVSL